MLPASTFTTPSSFGAALAGPAVAGSSLPVQAEASTMIVSMAEPRQERR